MTQPPTPESSGSKASTHTQSRSPFQTTTIDLAAYLMTVGVTLLGVENKEFPAHFVFNISRNDPKVLKMKGTYESGQVEANVRIFYHNLKTLQGLIRNGR